MLSADGFFASKLERPLPTRRAHLLVNALRRGERAPTSEDADEGDKAGGQAAFKF